MSKKAESSMVPFSIESVISQVSETAKPIEMGVTHFDSVSGASITGIFLGIGVKSRDEMSDPEVPDNRKKNLETVFIRVSDFLTKYTANEGAVGHFKFGGVKPGALVRLTCVQRGYQGTNENPGQKSSFKLEQLASADAMAERYPELSNALVGFLE